MSLKIKCLGMVTVLSLVATAQSATAQSPYYAYAAPVYYNNGYITAYQPDYLSLANSQARLMQLGYYVGPQGANGKSSVETIAAVKYFQSNNGIKVDGKVGPETRAALAGYTTNYYHPSSRFYSTNRTYVAPTQAYVAPAVTYVAPTRTYVAPVQTPRSVYRTNGQYYSYQPVNTSYYTYR